MTTELAPVLTALGDPTRRHVVQLLREGPKLLADAKAETTPPDVKHLRLCVSAGEPLAAPLYHRWVERTGVEVLDGLGATEVGYIYISNRRGAVRRRHEPPPVWPAARPPSQ